MPLAACQPVDALPTEPQQAHAPRFSAARAPTCMLARVVMSAQPSSPYGAMQSPRKRSCSEVSSPLGTCQYEGARGVSDGEGQLWERARRMPS